MEAHGLTREEPRSRDAREPRWRAALRRGLDVVLASAMLLLLAPLLVGVALAIRLESPGPAIFRQRRVGHRRREFTVFKFRSMQADCDPRGHREYVTALISGNGRPSEGGDSNLYKLAVDPRITGVGRWIRRWSIDELPQLLNVIVGDMALVGPRPAIAYEVDRYPEWYVERFDVKPGLTGLWQVSGRNERTYEEMVELDIEYARRSSLGLDLRILLKTPWVVLGRRGSA